MRAQIGLSEGGKVVARIENGVAWDNGCDFGQELTARTKYRGLIKKRLMPVAIDGPLPEPGTLVPREDGGEAGEIRSGQGDRSVAVIRVEALEMGGEVDG
jgi:folate-binding Fe-S cluster repair protein YgfZ